MTMEFVKRLDRELAHEMMCAIDTVYSRHDIPYWVTYGTLLGAIREKDFIEHDSDIDLFVMAGDIGRCIKAEKDFRELGFSCGNTGAILQSTKVRLQAQVIRYPEKWSFKADIYTLVPYLGVYWFVRHINRDKTTEGYPCPAEQLGQICEYALPYRAYWFNGCSSVILHGKRYPGPVSPHEFLDHLWGNRSRWETPAPNGQVGYRCAGVWFPRGTMVNETP